MVGFNPAWPYTNPMGKYNLTRKKNLPYIKKNNIMAGLGGGVVNAQQVKYEITPKIFFQIYNLVLHMNLCWTDRR